MFKLIKAPAHNVGFHEIDYRFEKDSIISSMISWVIMNYWQIFEVNKSNVCSLINENQ